MGIFNLLGMELFANIIKFDGIPPRCNFDTPFSAFVTIFIVIVGEDWHLVMYDHYRFLYERSKMEAYVSVAFFMILFFVGNIILLNLFLAILLANFENIETELKE